MKYIKIILFAGLLLKTGCSILPSEKDTYDLLYHPHHYVKGAVEPIYGPLN